MSQFLLRFQIMGCFCKNYFSKLYPPHLFLFKISIHYIPPSKLDFENFKNGSIHDMMENGVNKLAKE